MENVLLVKPKSGTGYFLTIGDDVVKHKWAVTALELLTLLKILKDIEEDLLKEIEELEVKKEEGKC